MDRDRRSEIVTGLFVLVAVAVFGLFAFRIGRLESFQFLKGHRIQAVVGFDEAKTLAVGARVQVAGRQVGEVTAIHLVQRPATVQDVQRLAGSTTTTQPLTPGQLRTVVDVHFDIVDQGLRIDSATAHAALVQDGFLGNHHVLLMPGHWPPEQIVKSVAELPPSTVLHIRSVESGTIDTLLPLLNDTVQAARDMLVNVNEGLLGRENQESVTMLLRELTLATRSMRALLDAGNADGVHESLMRPARQLLERGHSVLDQAAVLVQELQASVAAVQKDLQAVLNTGEQLVTENRAQLSESLRRLRGTLWQAEMAMRKIRANPAVLLFGDSETDLEALEQDETGVRRSGRVRIYQQRDEGQGGR